MRVSSWDTNADATDVFVAVCLAETKVLAKVVAYNIAVYDFDLQAMSEKLRGDGTADRGFARAAESGKPDRQSLLRRNIRTSVRAVGDLGRAIGNGIYDHSGGNRIVVESDR